jgi:tape measure domain-containing protein|nr:MAG TPA: Tail tape measure [Caudoviricetes sp.]
MTIRDGMTSKLRKITTALSRTNRALEVTDSLSDQVNPGANFDRASSAVSRASGQVDNFNRKQQQAQKEAKGVANAWGSVKKYIGSALAAISVQKIIDLADTMTTTRARIDLMNDGLQTTDELQSMIMASANRSRAAYQTTADAVSKMGIMAKDAFGNNAELIQFTELINKQFTIAGTSAAGVDAAMLQLTQAMSSGVLRGEELNSIFEQAPTIIQTIADYLGVPIGQIRAMAAEGQITSTIVKNAMLSSADEINAKFNAMPMTFAQVWTLAKNIALEAFGPVIQAIGAGAQWIYENWSTIAPIFWGLAGAAIAYAVALGIQTAATWIANGAAKAFFVTLLSNPLFWIALAVGVVIAALYKMIQAVGGVKNAWEICKAALVVAWTALKVAFFAVYNWIANLIDKLKLCWQKAGTAIANFMGDMKVSVLTVLQNMINGAIGIINDFISLLNKIPGVNISLIEQVTFATTAAAENEAAKQARADALNQYEADIKAAQAERDATYSAAKQELADATAQLSETYANARAEAAQANSDAGVSDWNTDQYDVGNVDSVGSVGSIESDVNIADEDLKFLRDVAEMRYVQNFVTLTPTVAVDAQISEKVDVDEVVTKIEKKLEDEFTAAAEGVYN